MHHIINCKTALAAALLVATGLAGAQTASDTAPSTPGMMNSTTSPNPLQTRPADGTPNSATGTQTPGTGTGSSRTMRNEGGMADPAGNARSGTTNGTSTTMQADEMMRNRSNGSTGSSGSTDSMNDTTTPAPMTRAARRDRG